MLYTTIPIPKQQLASDSFRSRRIGDEAPAPVFETRVSIMSAHTSMKISMFFQYLWAYTAAHLLQQSVPITTFCNALTSKTVETFLPTPPLIVTFREYNDTIRNLLSELGFSMQSSGRYKYAKGPSTVGGIDRLLKEGASADAYSMMGSCNIKGFVCFTIITRLLHSSLGFLCLAEDKLQDLWKLQSVDSTLWANYMVTSADSLPSTGILFPYFDGMVLPDKANVPRILLHIFSKCLGKTPGDLMTAARNIQEGWASLSTTGTGLIISHVIFGMNLALSGARLHIVVIGGVYQGFILSGSKFTVFKGGQEHKLLKQTELTAEFKKLDEHDEALLDLAEIISGAPLFEDRDKNEVVLPEQIRSPRRIHYALKIRAFEPAEQATISKLLSKLHFRQTYWDRSNDTQVLRVIKTLLEREWLPQDAPYCIQSGTVFSREPILSALAAFGDKSISLCGFGNNTTIALNKGKKFYEANSSVKLEGIPIFFKPISECYSDWESVLKTGVVTMKTGIKDKKGTTKVAGIGTYVTFSSPQYDQVTGLLATHIAQKIGKRKDRDSGEEGGGASGEPSAAKLKKAKVGNDGLYGLLGGGPSLPSAEGEPGGDMDIDPFA